MALFTQCFKLIALCRAVTAALGERGEIEERTVRERERPSKKRGEREKL